MSSLCCCTGVMYTFWPLGSLYEYVGGGARWFKILQIQGNRWRSVWKWTWPRFNQILFYHSHGRNDKARWGLITMQSQNLPLSVCWIPDHNRITRDNRSGRGMAWVTWNAYRSLRHSYWVTRHCRLNAPALSWCWFSGSAMCRGWFWQGRLTSNVPNGKRLIGLSLTYYQGKCLRQS